MQQLWSMKNHDLAREKNLEDLLKTFNLKWYINSPTHVTAKSVTAIDNVVKIIQI